MLSYVGYIPSLHVVAIGLVCVMPISHTPFIWPVPYRFQSFFFLFLFYLQFLHLYPYVSASVIVIPTHFIWFHCPHILHLTCPDLVLVWHMSHTFFPFVILLAFFIFLFICGLLSSTVILNGTPAGLKIKLKTMFSLYICMYIFSVA